MIPIKTCQEIDKMREGGIILAGIMDLLERMVKPNVATQELDRAALAAMSEKKARSAFKGYHGYPANICVSVNEEVVHGIPGKRRLIEGDIVSIDIGIDFGGFYTDMAKTFPVGKISAEKTRLIEVARASLETSIVKVRPGNRLSDVSSSVQTYVESNGFSVVRDFVGHGVGRELHEEPQIPNFGIPGKGPVLKEGMVLAIEPMINAGSWEVEILQDGWTAIAVDRRPSAHFEHTVAILKGEPVILTKK
ncbi:MAG TPA: type I methionyl aminopeptidase [Candidatus Omnitrophota bacterium]|nr:type I methionyl aminopeptidase [Candidatus Omnitrophota bacterium]